MINPITDRLSDGLELRKEADRLTEIRSKYSPYLGISISLDDGHSVLHTASNTIGSIYLDWTDWRDGKLARQAAELLGEETTQEGANNDHQADKKKYYFQSAGLILRYLFYEDDPNQAIFISVNTIVQGYRDVRMQKIREIAVKNDVDPKSRKIGKCKTWANAIGNTLHTVTPAISEEYRPYVQKLGNVSLGLGTLLSYAGLFDMKKHVDKSLKINMDL